ncbi:hypothetical protein PISMIDRAFT_675477 [Pisolithus microcarpus 441]|uniref:Unplaced genomic scaffold scaffold_15, whole genome shotgun sequence n=1 Tax=Pisolithus microcarpus 441 TaxID=765257 RepID=A0A0C9ZXA4_9AGAM|nr:hypothetical protein BKA83DRAFT_675477 [Pisolithus microcarpus]KIK26852.1 hypothetical protein PISMIDRAFT_675477 [Pisolithus microcarpus 441]
MTKIRDASLLTLFRHTNPDNSGTVNARAASCISSGRYRRVVSCLRKACDSVQNYLGYGPNAVGARRAASRRLHPFPRYLPNRLPLLHTRKHPYLQNHGVHRNE